MKVCELIQALTLLPQDAEVVLPHVWETDPSRYWAMTEDNIEINRAWKAVDGSFGLLDAGTNEIVVIR